jgi:hypothetical protein
MDVKAGVSAGNVPVARETSASQLVSMAKNLAVQMLEMEKRVYGRLEPVTRCDIPQQTVETDKVVEDWPPLFAQIRESLIGIQESIYGISRSIDRLDI